MDGWAVKELVGHAVNYRKQVSPSLEDLIPEENIRLFAVATRYPQKLAEQVALERCSDGVYEVQWGIDRIRVLVLSEVPAAEHNTVWNLFSGDARRIEAAARQLRSRRSEISTILNELFENYQREGFAMPYTMQDFMRDVTLEHLDLLRPDERLKGLSSEDLLKGLSSDERLKGLSIDERLRGLSIDERLEGLSPDEFEAYLRKRLGGRPQPPSEP